MRRKLHYTIICLFLSVVVIAQTKVEVITKTVKDKIPYKAGHTVELKGNAATISVKSWSKNEIGIELKLISKGLTRAIAEEELEFQKYVIDEINETHIIRNYLLLPKGLDKLSTIQETEIIIFLPNQVEILIENSFGNTSIQDHQGKVAVESKYGELKLANLTGEVKINSTFGDLEVSNFSGSMTCDLEHTATKIEGFTGDASVKTNLGDIVFTGIEELLRLKISAEKSDVILQFNKNNVDSYYWDIRSKYGEISFPNSGIEGKKISFGDDGNPAIYVSTDFGKITIK